MSVSPTYTVRLRNFAHDLGDDSHLPDQWKQPCRVATTANVTISTALNAGDTIDGVTLADGDRVFVKAQTAGAENGIYVAGATPARAADMDEASEVMGAVILVIAGTANAGTIWRNTNTTAPTIGSTALTFSQISVSAVAASAVSLTDAGGYWSSTDIEAWSQEIGALVEGVSAHGNTGSTETFSAVLAGVHTATLDANCTFTFTALASGLASGMVLILTQDGTGSRLVTWPGSVVWPGGTAPTLSTAAGAVDVLTFLSTDGGTTWYGFPTGGGASVTYATPAIVLGTAAAAGAASSTIRSDSTIVAFDSTVPVTQAYGDAAATGSVAFAARRDHKHGMPASATAGQLLIADTHSTPLIFADLIQTEAQDDLLYAD